MTQQNVLYMCVWVNWTILRLKPELIASMLKFDIHVLGKGFDEINYITVHAISSQPSWPNSL